MDLWKRFYKNIGGSFMYKNQHLQMEKRQRFSIRKLTVGTCSVLIGAFFFGVLQPVSAAEVTPTEVVAKGVEPAATETAASDKAAVEAETVTAKKE